MEKLGGRSFWKSQAPMLKHAEAENPQIFLTFNLNRFTFFNKFGHFLIWFEEYRSYCYSRNLPFYVCEILRTGNDICFVADIETYCPLALSDPELDIIKYTIKKTFREVYAKYGDADNLIFFEDHRPDSYKVDGTETNMMKISYHCLGLSELFNEMHTGCEMRKLARRVNIDMCAELKNKFVMVLPKDNVLDMGIYTRNRGVRTLYRRKTLKSDGFQLSEGSKHIDLVNCFVTKILSDEQKADPETYYSIPPALEASDDTVSQTTAMPKKRVYIPTDMNTGETTPEKMEAEFVIKNYLEQTYGDSITSVKYNGISNGNDSCEVRGHRHCPVCEEEHVRNCAYINELGGGTQLYKCMADTTNKRFYVKIDTPMRTLDTGGKYLESFAHVREKVISISAPMGSGKTYQIREFLKQFPQGTRVLFVTCRVGMANAISGLFPEYSVYLDKNNQDFQIQEYESMHKVSKTYDIIVLDEIRSTLNSASCVETNGNNGMTNMERLEDLCTSAKHVICCDADLKLDGCVDEFYDLVFKGYQIHHIEHIGGDPGLHHIFATDERFYERMMSDLENGLKIMVCCGSSKELKAIKEKALSILPEEEIGIYYADSPNQKEIVNVSKHWKRYSLIGFTSTITVSVSYDGPIDRVYVAPCRSSCGPREMNQMVSRARNIISGQVIVKYTGDPINHYPINMNINAFKNMEMNIIMARRATMKSIVSSYDKEFYQTIFRIGAGHYAKFFPSVLTHVWLWARVEEHLKLSHWYDHYIWILREKKYRFDLAVDGWKPSSKTEDDGMSLFLKEETKAVKERMLAMMDAADVSSMTRREYNFLMTKKIKGLASEEEVVKMKKFKVQEFYDFEVNGLFVEEFNKKKMAIHNRTKMDKLPAAVRRKIHSNEILMEKQVDTIRADERAIPQILQTLKALGYTGWGDRATKVNFATLSAPVKKKLGETLEFAKSIFMDRETDDKSVVQRLSGYMKKILGYKLLRKQVGKAKVVHYVIEDNVWPQMLKNHLFSNEWLQNHCLEWDEKSGLPGGTELTYMKQLLKEKRKVETISGHSTVEGLNEWGRKFGWKKMAT